MTPFVGLTIIAAAVAAWALNLRARERALRDTARACREAGLELLDETVALDGLGLTRAPSGRLALRRRYTFETTRDGHRRDRGWAVVIAGRTRAIAFEGPDGTTQFERIGGRWRERGDA